MTIAFDHRLLGRDARYRLWLIVAGMLVFGAAALWSQPAL